MIPAPAPPFVVKDAWLFDSEVIVPGQMSLVRFFQNTRRFAQERFGPKTRHETNLLGNGCALPRTYGMLVREIVVKFERAEPEVLSEIAESKLAFVVNQRTPVVDTTIVCAMHRFGLPQPYDLLELQCFGVEWEPPATLCDGREGEAPFLLRVALVGDLTITRYAPPDRNDWLWETHIALDHRELP